MTAQQDASPVRQPVKGTPEYNLWVEAIEVAIQAPLKQNGHTYSAQIPWYVIHDLRKAVAAVGIDWEKAARELREGR